MDEAPIERFQTFVKTYRAESGAMEYREKIQKMTVTGERSLVIRFDDLIRFDPELARTILENPEKTMNDLDQSLRRIIESAQWVGDILRSIWSRSEDWP